MPGQFINSGNNPGGKVSLVNNNNSGNLSISTPGGGGGERYFYLVNTGGTVPASDACSATTPLLNVVFAGGASMCDGGLIEFTSDTVIAPALDGVWMYDSLTGSVRKFNNDDIYTLVGPGCLFPC